MYQPIVRGFETIYIHMYHVDMNKMSNLFRQIVDAFCISVLRVRFLFLIYIYYDDVILQIDP